MGKFGSAQSPSKLPRLLFAIFSQRNIGTTGVLVGERPGGFTVPDEIKVEGHSGDDSTASPPHRKQITKMISGQKNILRRQG
jgi:hypothetical protein